MYYGLLSLAAKVPASGYGALTTAWIAATGETDLTIIGALNTLENDLTTYGLTSKIKALYPFVGGTSTKHSYNFMNTSQYQITWNGGGTHSSTGYLPNGTNGYGNTNFDATLLSLNNAHIAVYSRTNSDGLFCDIGYLTASSGSSDETNLFSKFSNNLYPRIHATNSGLSNSVTSAGLMMANRISSTTVKGIRNTTITDLSNTSVTVGTSTNDDIYIGALNNQTIPSPLYYSSREYALASIGEGLTDTEAANFYTAVQTFQTTLGRQVGVPIVSDADAQAFLNAAVITDTTQASAINTLVTGLKADGLWTKMKAIYPFVGGTATTHKYNLKDPQDTDAAFRLVFSGGWTHSSTGATPNGTNGYADSKFIPGSTYQNDNHMSIYLRSNVNEITVDIGVIDSLGQAFDIESRIAGTGYFQNHRTSSYVSFAVSDSRGQWLNTRTSSALQTVYKNGTSQATDTNSGTNQINYSVYLGSRNLQGSTNTFSSKEIAFASLGTSLNGTEAANLYTRVQTYQTALSRNV